MSADIKQTLTPSPDSDWGIAPMVGNREDTQTKVMADLLALPPLPKWQIDPYLKGGWHKFMKRPPRGTVTSYSDKNVHGEPIRLRRIEDLEKQCPVEVSSREQTLSTIRAMHSAGWTEEQALRMMFRPAAVGTTWLRLQKDPLRAFENCWKKVQEPPPARPAKRKRETAKVFVSNHADRERVWSFIEAHPGLGRNELLKAGCYMEGYKIEGRIKAALNVLKEDGRVFTKPGPRNAQFHFVTPLSE